MNFEVRYLSKSGNTKKIADAIAKTAGSRSLTIEHAVVKETDILFLGAAVYWTGVDSKMKAFINNLDSKVKKVVVFSTASFVTSAYPDMKKLLEKKNLTVAEQEFHCKGKFKMIHAEHPNVTDIEEAIKFTKSILSK